MNLVAELTIQCAHDESQSFDSPREGEEHVLSGVKAYLIPGTHCVTVTLPTPHGKVAKRTIKLTETDMTKHESLLDSIAGHNSMLRRDDVIDLRRRSQIY